jgi:hypothetical protein
VPNGGGTPAFSMMILDIGYAAPAVTLLLGSASPAD